MAVAARRFLAEVAVRARRRSMAVVSGPAVADGGPFRPVAEALVPAAPPALAEDRRLAPYRTVPGALLPGWPSGGRADDWVVDPVVVLGEALACCDPTSSWLRT